MSAHDDTTVPDGFLHVDAAADLLGLDNGYSVLQWVRDKRLPAYRRNGWVVLRREDVEVFRDSEPHRERLAYEAQRRADFARLEGA